MPKRVVSSTKIRTKKTTLPAQQPNPFFLSVLKPLTNITTNHVLVGLLLVASFLLGSLYTKVTYLEGKKTTTEQSVQGASAQAEPTAVPKKVKMDVGHLPSKGDPQAKVQIVEFADFRCPYCQQFYNTVEQQLIKDYVDTGKATFTFRHYAFLGQASTLASNASECANEQGKFWEMYDFLYKNQPSESDTSLYTVDNLTNAATDLGIATEQFRSCLSSNKYNDLVSEDFKVGQQAGVSGTPTFFINGTILVGAQPYSAFQSLIDTELK